MNIRIYFNFFLHFNTFHISTWPPPKEYHPTCQTTYSTSSDLILDGRCIATHVNSRNQRRQVQGSFSWSQGTQNAKYIHICSSYVFAFILCRRSVQYFISSSEVLHECLWGWILWDFHIKSREDKQLRGMTLPAVHRKSRGWLIICEAAIEVWICLEATLDGFDCFTGRAKGKCRCRPWIVRR